MNISGTPRHVAVIMDRNGEWAKRRTLSRMMGHREGVRTVKRVIKAAAKTDIEVLSLFAFSTENWLRPKDEVSFLMKLLEEFILSEGREFIEEGIRLVVSGRADRIPESAKRAVDKIIADSASGKSLTVNIALDYGGRDEMVNAARRMHDDIQAGKIDVNSLDEKLFSKYLYHPELPDVDLLIRTGGEQRISNFMLWQTAYSELHFTPVLWPDFGEKELLEAIEDFKGRKRRFGMTDEQLDN